LRARLAEWLIERQTLRMAREVISISPFVTEYYGREIRGRVHEIPNAIAASFFGLPRAPERGRILFAGRINQRKGALDLVHAVGRHPAMTSKLGFAGSSQDAAFEMHLREEIARLRLGSLVQFAGLLDEPSLLDEFSRAEVLVLPSYQETAPMVVQQAMAAGLAVVATDVGGIPHQIEHGATGLLFRAGDVEQLSTHIRRFHDDPALSQQLGSAAKSRAMTRFGAHRVASATRASYELILGDRHD
jgi:glycosyltransferase involved in cell wall biosynthesis